MEAFYISLLLYLGAVVLAFVDLFIPSGGMLILLAAVAAVASIIFAFESGQTMGMAMLTTVMASIPAFALVAIRIWPRTPIGRRIILHTQSSDRLAVSQQQLDHLVGSVFQCQAPIMPTGQLVIGAQRYSLIAESGMIDEGERFKVVAVRQRNLIVRATDEPLTEQSNHRDPANDSPVESGTVSPNHASSADAQRKLLDRPAEELGLDSID